MNKLEVFFDYTCPFCLKGHQNLNELISEYPGLIIEWFACEAHPRPEQHGRHSDLCARGLFFARDNGADIMEFHKRMYQKASVERADIEDINIILETVEGLLDSDKLREALTGDQYEDILLENNRLVWDEYDCPAVPSYRMNGELLKSKPGVGVSKEDLAAFVTKHFEK